MKVYIITEGTTACGFTVCGFSKNLNLAAAYMNTVKYRNKQNKLPPETIELLEIECSSTKELSEYVRGTYDECIYGDDEVTLYVSKSKLIDAVVVGTATDTFSGENSLLSFLERFVVRKDISTFRDIMWFVSWIRDNRIMHDTIVNESVVRCTEYLIRGTDAMLTHYDNCHLYLDIDGVIDIVAYGLWKRWWKDIR